MTVCNLTPLFADDPAFQAEPSPTFRASDLLVGDVLKGPNYELEEFVQVEKYKYVFRIRTEWGVMPAHGMNMLELRLREMYAIENARQLAKDPQFVTGVVETAFKTPQGVKILLTEPQGALLRAPKGFERLIREHVDPADRRAGSEARRRLALEVGCDPETSNPVLKALLDQMALRKGLGTLAAKAGLSIAVPGLALLPTTTEMKETVASKAPHEINLTLNKELETLGVPERTRGQFLQEMNYTTTQRLLFVHYLNPLREVSRVTTLVDGAVEAANQAEGLQVLQELVLLNEIHRRDPLREVDHHGLPVATAKSGMMYVVSAADYITNTAELAEAIAAHRSTFPEAPTTFYISGRVSAKAKTAFKASRIQVVER